MFVALPTLFTEICCFHCNVLQL